MKIAALFRFAHKLNAAYDMQFSKLCSETGIAQNAIYILLFLANNPDYNTAKDITNHCLIKSSLVSFHVDNLVNDGYLERVRDENDRRKIYLKCTKKAEDIIERGKQLQDDFFEKITDGITPELRKTFYEIGDIIEKNVDKFE